MKLTDAVVKKLPPPVSGNKVHYDDDVPGFGVRVTAAGARSFVLNYVTKAGRERRLTIGSFPDWTAGAARTEAKETRKRIDLGQDPLGDIHAVRGAPTVSDLASKFLGEHSSKKRPRTQREHSDMTAAFILPAIGSMKVAEVTDSDVNALHRKITKRGTRIRANRTLSLLHKMFALAVRWKMRSDNPATGIERNEEHKRSRYLSADELVRLAEALNWYHDQQAAIIIRLLLLTGARRGEVLAATWDQFDLDLGVWTKPGATTKQKTEHRIPLSAPARQLIAELPRDSEYLFPGRGSSHRVEIKYAWAAVCKKAGIKGAESTTYVTPMPPCSPPPVCRSPSSEPCSVIPRRKLRSAMPTCSTTRLGRRPRPSGRS